MTDGEEEPGRAAGSVNDVREGATLEYQALMAESSARIQVRHQTILSTLAFAAGFTAVGLGQEYVAFLYPLFALFLTASWWHNETRIRQISVYTRDKLSPILGHLHWDAHLKQLKKDTQVFGWPLVVAAPAGVFVSTEVLSIGIGIASSPGGIGTMFGSAFGIFVVVATVRMVWSVSRSTRQR